MAYDKSAVTPHKHSFSDTTMLNEKGDSILYLTCSNCVCTIEMPLNQRKYWGKVIADEISDAQVRFIQADPMANRYTSEYRTAMNIFEGAIKTALGEPT